ncbi:hypothetical protein RBB78_01750 [Tunturiibacter empetritectus]|uniref:hypothetical protein n=1 Tax=Tunturiibacter empetritectus TaxID=3069691 RepID=UPI003D9AB73D
MIPRYPDSFGSTDSFSVRINSLARASVAAGVAPCKPIIPATHIAASKNRLMPAD